MKNTTKSFLLVMLCLLCAVKASAQTSTVKITGTLTQKKNLEITLGGMVDNKSFRLAQYIVDTTANTFSFAIPVRTDVTYRMTVTVMKQGHRRLEPDFTVSFPLQLKAGQDLNYVINPTLLAKDKQTGLTVAKLPFKEPTVTINGSFTSTRIGGQFTFSKAAEGRSQPIQSYFNSKEDSTFAFYVPVDKEGFYYLSAQNWKKKVYLKPNDQLQLVVDPRTGLLTGSTKLTEENQVLQQWEQLISPLKASVRAKINSDEFTTAYQALQPQMKAFVEKVKTKNVEFNSLFKTAAQLDNNMIALNMLLKTSSVNKGPFSLMYKEFVNVPDYYKQTLKANTINSTNLLKFDDGNDYINLNAKLSLTNVDEAKRNAFTDGERVKIMMSATSNDTLKSYLLKSQLEELELSVGNYSEFRDVFLPYEKYAKVPSVKQKYNAMYTSYVADTVFIGKPAYDFTLPDMNGKMVNMKDFQGKVVLIDVWATWCGPCKTQMPFLKEVEDHYKGNDNVVFVGLSIDGAKDKEKWLKMIKEKQLEGVQLLDDFGKSFGRKYKMVAIPRFLLIDKKGNWAEIRCPKPEEKEKLIKYIDRELQRNI